MAKKTWLALAVTAAVLVACGGGVPSGDPPADDRPRITEDEYDVGGLVLLQKTVEAVSGKNGGEVTGVVENRRGRKLSYAQVNFALFDETGAQVGNALANVTDLASGKQWKFKAVSFGTSFKTYKVSSLKGF